MLTTRCVAALIALLSSGAMIPSAAYAVESQGCLSPLVRDWDQLGFGDKEHRVLSLPGPTLACLFDETADAAPPGADFFVDTAHRAARQVQRFIGKNSLPLFSRFEKHFFALENGSAWQLFGYNVSMIGRLLHSPGFFAAIWREDRPELILDYRPDMSSWISPARYEAIQGTAWRRVRGNRGNPIFGDLVDLMHSVTEDVTIGQSVKMDGGRPKPQSYFILLRTPD